MYMSLAVFNNIILGVALISNQRFAVTLPELIGFSLGSSLGFAFMLQLYLHARPRLCGADVPAAFRGLPVSLLYLGILSLALTGFVSVSFI
jgi:Na+-translocating ferredoxin:NAD+ oxidoreductase RnfA subunit